MLNSCYGELNSCYGDRKLDGLSRGLDTWIKADHRSDYWVIARQLLGRELGAEIMSL